MQSKYWSIHQVASALSVNPATLRRWIQDGMVGAVRLGGTGHRRIRYDELARMAQERAETPWPSLIPLDPARRYNVAEAARYLGVSARFLWNSKLLLTQGGEVTGGDILGWEPILYPDPANRKNAEQNWQEGEDMMGRYGMHHHGPGPMGMSSFGPEEGAGRFGPWDAEWDDSRPHSVLWLRSMKRHLETRKADIDDRLEWVETQLKKAEGRASD